MSKSALKRELATFNREQLVDVILAAYSSSKQARNYFEFFLSPDPEMLIQSCIDSIFKELKRVRRGGVSKGRISEIRKTVRLVSDYGLSDEYVAKMLISVISLMLGTARYITLTEVLARGAERFVAEYIEVCDRAGMASTAVEKLNSLFKQPHSGNDALRRRLIMAMNRQIEQM